MSTATKRVSQSRVSPQGDGNSFFSDISENGRFVAFESLATNLVTGVSGWHVYRWDGLTGAVALVSAARDGGAGNGSSYGTALSGSGRYVVFRSEATDLVGGVEPVVGQLYRRDMVEGVTIRISRDPHGEPLSRLPLEAMIAAEAPHLVGYTSVAPEVVPGGTGGLSVVLLRAVR